MFHMLSQVTCMVCRSFGIRAHPSEVARPTILQHTHMRCSFSPHACAFSRIVFAMAYSKQMPRVWPTVRPRVVLPVLPCTTVVSAAATARAQNCTEVLTPWTAPAALKWLQKCCPCHLAQCALAAATLMEKPGNRRRPLLQTAGLTAPASTRLHSW